MNYQCVTCVQELQVTYLYLKKPNYSYFEVGMLPRQTSVTALTLSASIQVKGTSNCFPLIEVELFICIFQILMSASQNRSVDQTQTAIIQMDHSIAPVSVITSRLQALSTFIQRAKLDVKVGTRMEEHTHTHRHTH